SRRELNGRFNAKKKKTENPVAVNNGNNGIVKNKKKNKEVAPFGNYRNYYGYRVGHDVEEDPRFKVLKKEWFEGKDCLDIGCNSGLITINIAKKFDCRTILGIDNIFLFLVTSYQ
ncbi:probable RNA methyltransferase At5g51130, partial [Chenopodium quinoa]|uniref:probable RNA methyltransferase At5g51130 n=1 Tax=Chenopodium quinoa TaxID=63459 RepID=UPI000B779D1A